MSGAHVFDSLWRRGVSAAVVLVVLIGAFALAAPASASILNTTDVTPDEWSDPCGNSYRVNYWGQPGESNRVETAFSEAQYVDPFTPGPVCGQITSDFASFADSGANIRASGRCTNAGPSAATCGAAYLTAYQINLGDQRDVLRVPADSPPATVFAGKANDALNLVNGNVGDSVTCGPGKDSAKVDAGDAVSSDCENVTRL